jgi:hypothetical protein
MHIIHNYDTGGKQEVARAAGILALGSMTDIRSHAG